MSPQQIENFEQSIAGLTVRDKQELIERLQCSIGAGEVGPSRSTRSAKRAKATEKKEPKAQMTEAEFDQYLVEIGLMSQIPDPSQDIDDDDPDDEPIVIKGEPLSETIIRERR